MRSLALVALLCTACRGSYPRTPTPSGGTGPRGVEAAALPYAIVDGHTGAAVDDAAFWSSVGAARVVCVGEDHENPHHHWAQLEIVDRVSAQRKVGLALGMEMVQRPFQAVLDDFAAGKIDEAALRSRVGWDDRWGYDYDLYRPMIAIAAGRGAALVALNVSRELTKKVVREGIEALTPAERAQLPAELDLADADHRAWFDGVMSGLGGAGHHQTEADEPAPEADPHHHPPAADQPAMPSADRVYAVQVIWDESMADGAATWAAGDGRAMVVLAGNGHCHDSAIVRRVLRRGVAPVISVRPIIDDGEGNVAAAILDRRNDYLFVMTMPR